MISLGVLVINRPRAGHSGASRMNRKSGVASLFEAVMWRLELASLMLVHRHVRNLFALTVALSPLLRCLLLPWGSPSGKNWTVVRLEFWAKFPPNPHGSVWFELCPNLDGGAGHHLGRHRHAAAVTRPDFRCCCTAPSCSSSRHSQSCIRDARLIPVAARGVLSPLQQQDIKRAVLSSGQAAVTRGLA